MKVKTTSRGNTHCKLATLSRRQKLMLPGGRYRSMSPAGRQSLQFYNEYIKWWPSANNFQCCPRAFGPRATLEIIGFGSPLDKASLLAGARVFFCPKFMLFEKAAANGYNLMPGSIGHFHELVATLVIFWPLLTHFGNLWQLLPMLAIFGNPW